MDVENKLMESNIKNMVCIFKSFFNFNCMDINYSTIDIKKGVIRTLTSNYEWHLTYWNNDLDMHINERLQPGIQHWNNYSLLHSQTLSKTTKNKAKVDICSQHDNIFELMSVNSNGKLSATDILTILKYKPVIADFASKLWKQKNQQDAILPIRAKNIYPIIQQLENESDEALNYHPYMRFGHIVFTRKEIITIRHLLSHCRIKEIAAFQNCSLSVERERIHRIKEKLNCQNQPTAALFKALKFHGVTLSCLETFIIYP